MFLNPKNKKNVIYWLPARRFWKGKWHSPNVVLERFLRSLKTISLLFTKTLQKYWKTNDKPSYSKNIFKTSYSVHIFGNIVLQTLFESKIFSCLIFRSSRWKGRTTPRDSFLTKYLTQKWRRSSATFRHERSFSTRGMTWYLTLLLEIQNTFRT